MPKMTLTARERKAGIDLRDVLGPTTGNKKVKFDVRSNLTGVRFTIDNQTFQLHVEYGEEDNVRTRNAWYAKMLRKALAKLARSGT